MGTVLDAVLERRSLPEEAVALGKKLLKRVDWFRLLGWAGKSVVTLTTGLPAIGVGTLVEAGAAAVRKAGDIDVDEAKKLLKEAPDGDDDVRRPVREFKRDFEALIEASGLKSVVVFIDDLDRCNPPTVIETLEAIKLFLFVKRTAFVIGADEDLVRHAVRERFPEVRGSAVDVSTNYLEKLVQVPLRVPPLGRAEMETYMNLLFAELHLGVAETRVMVTAHGPREPAAIGSVGFTYEAVRTARGTEHAELEDDLAMVAQTADILTAGLKGNPRQTKRFLNALLLRMEMAEARGVPLRRRVLAKLMLLEYLQPPRFAELGDWQASNAGRARPLAALERAAAELPSDDAPAAITVAAEPIAGQMASRPEPSAGLGPGKTPRATAPRGERSDRDGARDAVPSDSAHWMEEPWVRQWLRLDPSLGDVDLRPYYFFSRDLLTVSERAAGRMSAGARRLLVELQSDSDVRLTAALKQATTMAPADAAAIFEVLAEQARRTEDLRGTRSPLAVLLRFAKERPELVAEAVRAVAGLEDSRLGGGVPPLLHDLVANTPSTPAGSDLLSRWAKSDSPGLSVAAEMALKPRAGRTTPGKGR
jgi:hypothetical protein